MKGRIALTTGAAAVLVASLCLGPGDVRAGGTGDEDQKIEKRVVVRHAGGGRLGVSIEDPPGDTRGAAVRSVDAGSAAEKAGIKEGDVIARFDGEAVRSSSQLARLVAETPAGRAVAIEVTRGGATQKLSATLAEGGKHVRVFSGHGHDFSFDMPEWEVEVPPPPAPPHAAPPAPPHAAMPPHPPMPPGAPRAPRAWSWKGDSGDFVFRMFEGGPRKLGIQYVELGEQLAGYFKLSGQSGVLVTSVDAEGPAAKAGMKAGDVILKLAGEAIADGDDLRDAVSKAEAGSEVGVTVQRDGRPVELKVTLAKPAPRQKRREARGVSL
jgi:membrane-associated protease RseP (regulator of RpoE activity)